jgi:hypothetical protein
MDAIIHLYTSPQADAKVYNLAFDIQQQTKRHVIVRPLSTLPAPLPENRSRRHQLQQELRDVQQMLKSVDYFIAVGKQEPHKYPHQLVQLHLDAAKHQARVIEIQALLRREGGPNNG